MAKIASEVLVERLADWGVDTIFGLPGDGINGIMEGLRRHQDKLDFVLCHHEEAAAFMAVGYAKATGKLGVVLATSGPGGLHLTNPLYDAKLDHIPLLAITGMQEVDLLGTAYQQEVHLEKTFQDVADYNTILTVPASIPTLVDNAVRTAFSHRTVSHLTFPNDIQLADAGANPWTQVAPARPPETAPVYFPNPCLPPRQQLERAAEILNRGAKVVMLVGFGARHTRQEVLQAAEILGAPVVKTLVGKHVTPDDHPLTTGGIGLLGTKPSVEAMNGCDTLLMVGTNFPYTKYLPAPGQARVVQIEIEAQRAGWRIPTDAPLVGDSRETLKALMPLLERKTDRGFLEEAQQGMAAWRDNMLALEDPDRDPMQPQYLAAVLDDLATDDAILTCDSGTIATWAARHWHIRGNREFYISGNLATMAPGLPYAIGIQKAYPERQVVAFIGDGGYAMLMAETLTAIRYGFPVKIVINNNAEYGQILWEQMVLGYPEYGVRHKTFANFAPFAEANGAFAAHVEKPEELRDAMTRAFAHDGPALVDVVTNRDEPPMPPKVSYEEAKNLAEAFVKGQPRRLSIAKTIWRDQIDKLMG